MTLKRKIAARMAFDVLLYVQVCCYTMIKYKKMC